MIKIGESLPEEIAENLKVFTGHSDRVQVSEDTGVSASTIRDVIYLGNKVTKKNLKGMKKLILIASENCKASIDAARNADVIFEQLS